MFSRNNWAKIYIFVAFVVLFVACGYEPPSVGPGSTSSSSSSSSTSSSGMGGVGAGEQSSSSSSGNGGVGGLPSGAGGLGGSGGSGGSGGMGGVPVPSSSSGDGGKGVGGGGMGGSSPADPKIQNCPIADCDTSNINAVCCKPKDGTEASCNMLTGLCFDATEYALKCDDKADCGAEFCCLATGGRAMCGANCINKILCKVKADCPAGMNCGMTLPGGLLVCSQ